MKPTPTKPMRKHHPSRVPVSKQRVAATVTLSSTVIAGSVRRRQPVTMEPTAHEKICCLEQATLAKDFLSFVTSARETMKKYELESQAAKYELSSCQQEVIALRGSVEKVSALEEELIRHRAVESELRSSFEMERLERERLNAELDRTNALLRQTALFCVHQGVTAAQVVSESSFTDRATELIAERFINELRFRNPPSNVSQPATPIGHPQGSVKRVLLSAAPPSSSTSRRLQDCRSQTRPRQHRRSKSVDFAPLSRAATPSFMRSGMTTPTPTIHRVASVSDMLAATPSMSRHKLAHDDESTIVDTGYESSVPPRPPSVLRFTQQTPTAGNGTLRNTGGSHQKKSAVKFLGLGRSAGLKKAAENKENIGSSERTLLCSKEKAAPQSSVTARLALLCKSMNRTGMIRSPAPSKSSGKRLPDYRLMTSSKSKTHTFYHAQPPAGNTCHACGEKFKNCVAVKCAKCRGACHEECKGDLALPCTRFQPSEDYPIHDLRAVTGTCPSIPVVLIRCAWEIERRGMDDVDMYDVQVPKDITDELLDHFQAARSTADFPSLRHYPVSVVAGLLKAYLAALVPPLLSFNPTKDDDVAKRLQDATYDCEKSKALVDGLSVVARDTLSFLVLHFKKMVARACPERSSLPAMKLAEAVGPLVFGDDVDSFLATAVLKNLIHEVPENFFEKKLADSTAGGGIDGIRSNSATPAAGGAGHHLGLFGRVRASKHLGL